MQNKANHNSILLLTTLGVYIGLLLVGAPTGVLAQPAAMTRNFEISEEIAKTDDLDNDPLSEEDADLAVGDHLNITPAAVWPVHATAAAFTCGQNWFAAPVYSDTLNAGLHSGSSEAFARFKPDADDVNYELTKSLLKHTSLTVADEQVFTVTRLPRSDIDPLFASDAK